MWGYPVFVLGAVCSFLEPFCGHLSPNIDNVSEKLTLRYLHEGPWVGVPGGRVGTNETLPLSHHFYLTQDVFKVVLHK